MGCNKSKAEEPPMRYVPLECIPGIGLCGAAWLRKKYHELMTSHDLWALFELKRKGNNYSEFVNWLSTVEALHSWHIVRCIKYLEAVSNTIDNENTRLHLAILICRDRRMYTDLIKNTEEFLKTHYTSNADSEVLAQTGHLSEILAQKYVSGKLLEVYLLHY